MAKLESFRITRPTYRLGVMYEPGETITIDLDKEKPGKTWQKLDVADKEAFLAPSLAEPVIPAETPATLSEMQKPVAPTKGKRAADQSPV